MDKNLENTIKFLERIAKSLTDERSKKTLLNIASAYALRTQLLREMLDYKHSCEELIVELRTENEILRSENENLKKDK